ncbi:MAG: hypothetical protein KDD22_03255 [Bdellovibrionales bacterium]|nr:hypothetical protein [Bdellovibrionales bacterium]
MIRPEEVKILVAHDEPGALDEMGRRFEIFGFSADTVLSVPAALSRLQAEPKKYNVLIASLDESDTDNLQNLHWITDIKKKNPDEPRLFVLTREIDTVRRHLLHLGADGVLRPPLDTKNLIIWARKALMSPLERWQLPPTEQMDTFLTFKFESLQKAQEKKLFRLGHGGFLIKVDNALPATGTLMAIDIDVAPLRLKGAARIVWTDKTVDGYLAGFELIHLKSKEADKVGDWVKAAKPIAFIPSDFDR